MHYGIIRYSPNITCPMGTRFNTIMKNFEWSIGLKSSANRTKLGRSFRKIFKDRISCNECYLIIQSYYCRNKYKIEMIYNGIADCRLNWKIWAFRLLPLFRRRCINIFNSNFNLGFVKIID